MINICKARAERFTTKESKPKSSRIIHHDQGMPNKNYLVDHPLHTAHGGGKWGPRKVSSMQKTLNIFISD